MSEIKKIHNLEFLQVNTSSTFCGSTVVLSAASVAGFTGRLKAYTVKRNIPYS